MNEKEFCYWLQGLFELSDAETLDERQVQIIRDHLNLVFNKVTPNYFDINPLGTQPIISPHITCGSQQTFCLEDVDARPIGSC